jgi:prepilin-type N-terminal cleavage/methylation domain-containing protein
MGDEMADERLKDKGQTMMVWRPRFQKADCETHAAGFTLVELLISIAVISILAGMAAQVFSILLDSRETAMKRIEISETANAALEFISADLRAAYLTPDSVLPRIAQNDPAPRFRFAGISRDIIIPDLPPSVQAQIPGAGKDDDGDGLIDEEILDGLDGDYPNIRSALTLTGRTVTDPLGCEEGDEACIDEDIGIFPSDLLHFVSAIENSGELVLQEVSYGLNPAGTKLIRRAQIFKPAGTTDLVSFNDFGQFIDDTTKLGLVPPALPLGQAGAITPAAVKRYTDNWDTGAETGSLSSTTTNPQYVDRTFEVLAYDIRGLRFRYWYYDYNRGGWRAVKEWDSARESAFTTPDQFMFNQPAANNSLEGYIRRGFQNVIVNEPDDMYPRTSGVGTSFLVTSPAELLNQYLSKRGTYLDTANRIAQKTDGLPNMVEITIYVQDRDHTVNPKRFTLRVSIPNNYRNIGS